MSTEKRPEIRSETVWVTPEMAAAWLARNTANRPIRRNHVLRLASAMARGEFEFNGSAIRIANTGRLLDGQHRLTACVEARVPFQTLVVTGLDENCFATIDQAACPRKISDALSIEVGASMKNVTASLACLYQLRVYGSLSRSHAMHGFNVAVARELLNRHTGIIDSTRASNVTTLWRSSFCACLHYAFSIVDATLAEDFINVLRNGSAETRRPFNVFREGMIRLRKGSAWPDQRPAAARAIKAFNLEVSGRTASLLTWRVDEEFPRISGLDYDSI